MGRIITVGREFGSGGRELGRRMAEYLNIEYYDQEIIKAISEHTKLSENYVKGIVENRNRALYPISFGHSAQLYRDPLMVNTVEVFRTQRDIIREMAGKSDCVIVGRCADYILEDMNPLTIFVYASMEARIARCREREENKEMSDAEIKKMIKKIDRQRAEYYGMYTSKVWGKKESYNLCVNTTGADIKKLAKALSAVCE